jgi:uncharacterized membrane protein YedE/YeeE
MKQMLPVFFAGLLFGAGLALSGMTDPQRVIDFLDITGDWDPTLMFVMGGALTVFGSGWLFLRKRCGHGLFGCSLPDMSSAPISKRLLIGSALFGVGWGIGGVCPGPGLANLSMLRHEALAFVAAMAIGVILVQRLFRLDRYRRP